MKYHTPVLLQPVLEFIKPKPGKLFIDATIGGGGHTIPILDAKSKVLGIDRDPEAVSYIKGQNLENLTVEKGNFADILKIAKRNGFEKVDGIILDLGVSSHQLQNPQRGFSFQNEGPLDMRMDPDLNIKAEDIINNFDKRRLYEIFETYGQEKLSWAIAAAVCSARKVRPIKSTKQLSQVIEQVYKRGVRGKLKINPSTKVFQALRIVVNSELLNLNECLPQTVHLLKPGGRLVIISFHSLEDGIVKRFFKQQENLRVLTQKPIGPGEKEIIENPRSRSARLRVAEKI